MAESSNGIHLDLDGAVSPAAAQLGLPTFDAPEWGPQLRYCAPGWVMRDFYEQVGPFLKPFVLTGSGDFHHLTALWLQAVEEPFSLFVFDNHPEWDVRPPRWSCGGWVNRVLENPHVKRVVVWGCGNFELRFPARVFASRRALRSGRLEVRPWAERLSVVDRRRYWCMDRSGWKGEFEKEARRLKGSRVYVSIDLDCLAANWAACNWENGLFEPDDLVWALALLRSQAEVVGGDLCGAFSKPRYARFWQGVVAGYDHPRWKGRSMEPMDGITNQAVIKIWPSLEG